jgi:2-phosphoglycolate phosphatase
MNLPTPRAVFFDLDGTLIDSYDAITSSVNHVRLNRSLEPLTVDEVRPKVGHGVEKLLRSTVPGTDLASDIPLYKEHHQGACVQYTRLLPGAVELLDLLASHGISAGICSNKPKGFTSLILQALEIEGRFATVCGPEDTSHPKPHPGMLLEAGRRLNVSLGDSLYVGDMLVDIQAGRAAGCPIWVVATGSDTHEALSEGQPDGLFADLWALASALNLGKAK